MTKRKDRPDRLCECGCGRPVPEDLRAHARYATRACQNRAKQRRLRARRKSA